MQRLLDAVGSKTAQVKESVAGGEDKQEATTSSTQATQDAPPATTANNNTTTSAASGPEHTSPEVSTFVVVSDPANEGDNAFTVYSAEQLEQPSAPMASSSSNPDGAPAINWPPSEAEMKGDQPPRAAPLKSSRAYSVASPAADLSRREPLKADNPHRIPTAGGVALGVRASQEREFRRKSRASSGDLPKFENDGAGGASDAVTANNTQANVAPARINADNGEGSSKLEPGPELEQVRSPSAPEVAPIPDAPAATENAAPVANGNEVPTVKAVENTDAPAATEPEAPVTNDVAAEKLEPPKAAAPQERRGSVMDRALGKLGIGKKK